MKQNCWEANEARALLAAAKAAGPQPAALFAVALDTGVRKNELCGLQWTDLDAEQGAVTIMRQLTRTGRQPTFGPVKNGTPRTIDLSAETLELLKAHKRAQAELKMRNRTAYQDHGLMFAKEWGDLHGREDSLGLPLQSNNLGQREFARLIKAAKVRPITIHGLRHTSATLLLKAGVAPHVVQQRLGHKKISTTLDIYACVAVDAAGRSEATRRALAWVNKKGWSVTERLECYLDRVVVEVVDSPVRGDRDGSAMSRFLHRPN